MTAPNSPYSFGFVTIATGKNRYVEMAVDMALSLRRFHDEPIVLLAHGKPLARAKEAYANVFDMIVELPEAYKNGRNAKFSVVDYAPMQRGMFIDADIVVLAPLTAQIEECGRAPVSMMGRFAPSTSDFMHHGIPASKLCSLFGTDRFFTNHSGCFLYDRERARPLMREAAMVFEELLDVRPGPFIGDELAFGIAAARLGMVSMGHPYPVIWPNEWNAFDFETPTKPLFHLIGAPSAEVLDKILLRVIELRKDAGLDAEASIKAWKAKALRSSFDPKVIGERLANLLKRPFRQRQGE